MRTFASVFALVLLLSVSEGAVLLRFINTVPTRQNVNSYETGGITASTYRLTTSPNILIDRVALGYVASGATAPTYLWTDAISTDIQGVAAAENGANAIAANLAWEMAMPPLRAFHGTGATDATDSVAPPGAFAAGSAFIGSEITEVGIDQTILKSDGVGLYLSLAAGTYTFNAYAVLSGGTAATTYTATPSIFPTTKDSVFTFEDGKVYTLVAVGDGKYSTTPLPLTGTDVALKLFEENTTPATFGKASVRFFHAVKSSKADTINVYLGSSATSPLVSGIAFGGLSSYVDVSPSAGQLFPITASSNPNSFIAPSSLDKKEVTLELRAGTRATIICAMDNEVAQKVFCRIIPSRVAAYVRLVNDLAASTFMHVGPVTGQPLNKVTLTLWAASEVPRPDQLAELSQAGSTRTITNHILNIRGLYKVVTNVAAGTASGYGEVFVPLPIMDFAVRYSVVIDTADTLGNAGGYVATKTNADLTGAIATNWFLGGIIAKRVHFAIRTNGGATLASSATNSASKLPQTADAGWIKNSLLVDRFVDAGSYNTIFAFPNKGTTPPTNTGLPVMQPVIFTWRTDRTSAQVTSGIPSGSAYVSLVPFAYEGTAAAQLLVNQAFALGTLNIRQGTSSPLTKAYLVGDEPAVIVVGATAALTDLTAKVPHFTIPAGSYTYDFTPKSSADACYNALPGTNSLTVAAGQAYDIFVMNTRGCASARRADANQLVVASVQQQSAAATGNADGTVLVSSGVTTTTTSTSTFYFAAASSNTMSISFIVAALFAIIAALL